jgi:sigma-B regulation protein RsbU (phosphoserine phosphatase)
MHPEEALRAFANAPLFKGLPDPRVREIFDSGKVVHVPAGVRVFNAGDPGDVLFVVLEGEVAIQEQAVSLTIRRPGDLVGELAVLHPGVRAASAMARTDVVLFRWGREAFHAALDDTPALARAMIAVLVSKLRESVPPRVEAVRKRESLEQDLLLAREIQRAMLPDGDLQTETIELSGWCRPALAVGGDHFDYVDLGLDGVSVVLSDVEGKGLPASLMVAMASGCYRTQTRLDPSPHAIAGAFNRAVSSASLRMMSSFCALLDSRRALLTYCSAGHPPAYLCHEGEIELLGADATLLGFPGLEDRSFASKTRRWRAGDVLVVYSDGVTDATNDMDALFGSARLETFLQSAPRPSAAAVRDALIARIKEYVGNAEQPDDITILVARAR